MLEFNVIKFNYKNKKIRKTHVHINIHESQIYYENSCKNKKKINNIVGIIYGPVTTRFIKENKIKNPYLCLSIIRQDRTYDFLFESINDLKIFLSRTKTFINSRNVGIHQFTPAYINFVIRKCINNLNINNTETFINNIISKWDFTTNKIKQRKIFKYSPSLNYFNNEGCMICLDEFVIGESCFLFSCKHLYHYNCVHEYVNMTKKKIECVICHSD